MPRLILKWLLLALLVWSCKNKDNVSESEIRAAKFEANLKEIREHTEWIEKTLKFESELRRIMLAMGYSIKRANDSVIADQDRIYFDTINYKSDRQELRWYREHRKDLEKFPEEYRKQFGTEK